MNDFTKEELDFILECVTPDDSPLSGGWYREPDIAYRLTDKIQSMIDSYCEHEDDDNFYFTKTTLEPMIRCKKCGEFYR